MTCEQWVRCSVNADYEVSNLGNIRRATAGVGTRAGRVLKPTLDKKGYRNVSIRASGKERTFKLHRLIALAWIPNPDSLETVNHIDGNKLNNEVGNLEWCSAKDNIAHAFRTGLKKFGEDHERAILSSSDVLNARKHLMAGESLSMVGRRLGVSQWTIHNIVRGLTWKHIPSDPDWEIFLTTRRAAARRR